MMERELALKVAERYANGSRAVRGYVAGKLRTDPVIGRIIELGREQHLGRVADIGCGRGQLGVALLEAGVCTSVRGVDWDEKKIEAAREASHGLDVELDVGDVREWNVPACDTVTILDVLHYLPASSQKEILTRAAIAKCVIVRELDPDRGWRSMVTRAQEAITTAFGYNKAGTGERLEYTAIASFVTQLEQYGFTVVTEPAWGSTPFANVLLVARRA